MIFTIKCGKTFLVSVFVLLAAVSCRAKAENEKLSLIGDKRVNGVVMSSYADSTLKFTLVSDSGRSSDSTESFILFKPVYRREEGESVTVASDSCLSGSDVITYYGNVRVDFEDSMVLLTDSMVYYVKSDSAMTEDSVLIVKNSNKMRTKGFSGGEGFKKIVFPERVVLYGD
ncbi:MAG: LPS export ABC transporter periplasmic protein LptC [bacterium]